MFATSGIGYLLRKFSVQQKIKLLSGRDLSYLGSLPELDIPFSDVFIGIPSTGFPASIRLESSFDIDLVRRIGEALGDECRAKSTHVLLAPTVNTHRSPLGGCGFESFSEDPPLNGTIAAAYINGLQSKGFGATVKHCAANDQEFARFSISSEVSEHALPEIYLNPFQIAIKNANPWALMTVYNRDNGVHASEDFKLLQDILDWAGDYSTVDSLSAGVDLENVGPSVMHGPALLRMLTTQEVTMNDIDKRVSNLIECAQGSGILFFGSECSMDTPELRQLLRTAAADSIAPLKNDKQVLPPKKEYKKISVIGRLQKSLYDRWLS